MEETEYTTSKAEKSGFLVCQGAQCMCKFGSNPAELLVLTQTKHYVNDNAGSQKLIASHLDIGVPYKPPFFGSCKKMLNKPCNPVITAWKEYYEDVELSHGGMPLLDKSTCTCAIGTPDCINIIQHGQKGSASGANAANAEEKVHSQINPLVNPKAIDDKDPFAGVNLTGES
jgi:hypothetical protein